MEQKKAITISLIIPVYNVSPYIERCLKSVIKQTYNHFECILVDDASPDDSIDKCERMIATYDGPIQFRILHHQENRGLSTARNTGTDAATGDYILYIDSDDLISNDCVEKLMTPVLKDNSIEMVYGGWMVFSDKETMKLPRNFKWEKKEYTTQEGVRSFFFNSKHLFIAGAWNKLISRDFLNRYDLRFKEDQLWEDVLWSFFVMKHLSHLYSIPDVTYFYYQRKNSISSSTNEEKRIEHLGVISDIISTHFTPGEEGKEASYYVWDFCKHYIRQSKSKQHRATARRFRKALPFSAYPIEKTLLWVTCLLPRNKTGVDLFTWVYKRFHHIHEKQEGAPS
jgi:glycosyltransferase involved in cell wall biosynthesis